jgi:hypothetical protein
MSTAIKYDGWVRIFATVTVLWAGVATAQPAPDAPTPAQVLFAEGRALLEAQQPAAACEKFEASLKLEPDAPGPMLNLGLCQEQLDHLATALHWFRRVQARASELHLPDVEAAAKDKTGALAASVPTLKLTFSRTPPPGVRVTVDGAKVDEIDFARFELDAGHHVVAAEVPNVPNEMIEITDGEAKTVVLHMPEPPPPPKKEWVTIDRGRDRRLLAYIVGGVGAGLLVGDTVFVLVAKHDYDATEHPATRQNLQNAVRYGGTSAFVVGGAAVAVAAYLYLHAPGPERVERTVVTPTIDRGHVGLALSGAF